MSGHVWFMPVVPSRRIFRVTPVKGAMIIELFPGTKRNCYLSSIPTKQPCGYGCFWPLRSAKYTSLPQQNLQKRWEQRLWRMSEFLERHFRQTPLHSWFSIPWQDVRWGYYIGNLGLSQNWGIQFNYLGSCEVLWHQHVSTHDKGNTEMV